MKKLLAAIMLCTSLPLAAQHRHNHHHHHHHYRHHGNWNWVAPAVIGGAIAYAITRPTEPVQAPVNVYPAYPSDLVYIDGVAYRRQLVLINGYYQEVFVRL